jgi:hypothetical protein
MTAVVAVWGSPLLNFLHFPVFRPHFPDKIRQIRNFLLVKPSREGRGRLLGHGMYGRERELFWTYSTVELSVREARNWMG